MQPIPRNRFLEELLPIIPQLAQEEEGAGKQKKKTWIEIALKDKRGEPIPNERYQLKLPDGTVQEGTLDGDGKARVSGIDPGSAQVCFPEIDGGDWRPA